MDDGHGWGWVAFEIETGYVFDAFFYMKQVSIYLIQRKKQGYGMQMLEK